MPKQAKNAISRELSGIIYLSVSILLACILFSYDPRDIPWLSSPPTSHNWIGITGAYIGWAMYSLVGGTANILPLVALFLSCSALFRSDYRLKSSALWMLAFVFSMTCLIQVLSGGEVAWKSSPRHFFGYGGFTGLYIGGKIFWHFLKHGALIIFFIGSAASLFMSLQLNPRELIELTREQLRARRTEKREEALRSGDIKTVLRTREEEITERQKLLERELVRRSRKIPTEARATTSEPDKVEPAKPTPAPKVEKTVDETPTPSKSPAKTEKPPAPVSEAPPAPVSHAPVTVAPAPVTPSEPAPAPKVEKPEYKITRPAKPKAIPRAPTQLTLAGPYNLPPLSLLKTSVSSTILQDSKEEIARRGALIETTLKDFGIEVQMGEITQGATITRYEVIPSPGVKVERIVNLANNLSLALKAERVNILAPVAGKGTVGIEMANTTKPPVLIREMIASPEFQNTKARIPLALGKDVYGKTLIADLAEMPHLLIAGSTGSGKSVCINSIISSILYRFSPEDMRLILIDPKVVELQIYNTLPHLVVPVVSDPKKVLVALRWVIREMEKRYKIMAKVNVRNITTFNARPKQEKAAVKTEDLADLQKAVEEGGEEDPQPLLIPEDEVIVPDRMPYIVVVIDELADLMMTASVDAEAAITRITQMARAAGIHLVVATQTPRANVVTGTIKTNLPCKISLRVASKIDSRVILDENGAENLLGKGDMIYKSAESSVMQRAQGAFISDDEVKIIVESCAKQVPASYDVEIHEKLSKPASSNGEEASEEDEEVVQKCIEVIKQERRASVSLMQRRLRLGYTRAARIMDLLEDRGMVGPSNGSKDRDILFPMDGASPTG